MKHNNDNRYNHINRTFRLISLTEKLYYLHTKRILGQNVREGILLTKYCSYHEMGVNSKNVCLGGADDFWALLAKNHILHDLIRECVQTFLAVVFNVTFFFSGSAEICAMSGFEAAARTHFVHEALRKTLKLSSVGQKWVSKEPKPKGQCMRGIYNNYLKLKCMYYGRHSWWEKCIFF